MRGNARGEADEAGVKIWPVLGLRNLYMRHESSIPFCWHFPIKRMEILCEISLIKVNFLRDMFSLFALFGIYRCDGACSADLSRFGYVLGMQQRDSQLS